MLTRRQFLGRSAAIVSVGLVTGPTVFERALRHASVATAGMPADDRVLVVVQLAGGNDGLNTVVPYSDSRYRDVRRDIAVPEGQGHILDSRVALHPNMGWFKEMWDRGSLAIVESVGYPNHNRSHFESTAVWQTADPTVTAEGWLGRSLRGVVDDEGHPFSAVAVSDLTPQAFVADGVAIPSFSRIEQYRIAPGPGRYDPSTALVQLYEQYPPNAPYAALLDSTMHEVYKSTTALQQLHTAYQPAVTYPEESLASGLRVLAETISAQVGMRIGYVSIGGFDTHDSQLIGQPPLLARLDAGLRAFFADLEAHGQSDRVVTLIWTEFGRRVKQNASGGTDHGKGNALFVAGAPVKGGFYGSPTDLGALDDGDIAVRTDFRSVYATVLGDWMGIDPAQTLGSSYPTLGLVGAATGVAAGASANPFR